MALRSPTPFHNFWGANFASAADLPNVSGSGTQNGNLEAGDFAYVPVDSTYYICTSATLGAATWVAVTTGAATIDRFAPRYIVGGPNDSDVAYDFGGFRYIPTQNNLTWQTDLQAALLAAPGDVHFRPGAFALSPALIVPSDCAIQGAGDSTQFTVTAAGDGTLAAFVLLANSKISDCIIVATAGALSTDATTTSVVFADPGLGPTPGIVRVENVRAEYNRDATATTACQSIFLAGAGMSLVGSNCSTSLVGTLTPETNSGSLCAWHSVTGASLTLSSCSHVGSDAAVISEGFGLNLSQFSSANTTYVGVGCYTDSVASIVNSKIEALTGYSVQIDNADCVIGLSNSYLNAADAAPAFASLGSGRVVGNSLIGASAAIDTSAGQGHVIGFNGFTGSVATSLSDEVAHNI